eukprot:snap_masked-scaffold_23-processed-gene-0.39-mRNA-1 protein AED:1.00 eAED:1.00 QI:0/0/0/0/1/1/2/0/81
MILPTASLRPKVYPYSAKLEIEPSIKFKFNPTINISYTPESCPSSSDISALTTAAPSAKQLRQTFRHTGPLSAPLPTSYAF